MYPDRKTAPRNRKNRLPNCQLFGCWRSASKQHFPFCCKEHARIYAKTKAQTELISRQIPRDAAKHISLGEQRVFVGQR